jgi:indoleamine 2,3-dioxygenase
LKPVNSYASTTQYNYRLIDPYGPFDLTNLALKETFTGSMDEVWFFLVPVAIEALGGPAIAKITRALEAVIGNDVVTLTRTLLELREIIDKITAVLVRMYENCDPHAFFTYIRPFLAGWAGYTELMPDGLLYEGTEGVEDFEMVREGPGSCLYMDPDEPANLGPRRKSYSRLAQQFTESMRVTPMASQHPTEFSHGIGSRRKYAGGSAAQSPIIHCLDMALGIEHQPQPIGKPEQGEKGPARPPSPTASLHSPHSHDRTGTRKNFITEMRAYMPGSHREYLYALADGPNIRQFVQTLANALSPSRQDSECVSAYDACIEALKVFRDKHLQVVAVYIIIQGKKREGATLASPHGSMTDVATGISGPSPALVEKKSLLTKGTGGTNILPFLRQSRQETEVSRLKDGLEKSENVEK